MPTPDAYRKIENTSAGAGAPSAYEQPTSDLGGGGGGSSTITVGIVPHSGGGSSEATQLNYGYNGIVNTFEDSDSVQLPQAIAGSVVWIFIQNYVETTVLAVFSKVGTSDTINGLSDSQFNLFSNVAETSTSIAAVAVCSVDGEWWSNLVSD